MKPLIEEIADLELARYRLEQWRTRSRDDDPGVATPIDPVGAPPPETNSLLILSSAHSGTA